MGDEEINMTYKVVLNQLGNRKIETIKVYREYAGVGLKEAKMSVENLPSVVVGNLSKEEAEKIASAIENVGVGNKTLIEKEVRENDNNYVEEDVSAKKIKNVTENREINLKNDDALLRCPLCGTSNVGKIKIKEDDNATFMEKIKRKIFRYRWYCKICGNEW